jgi:hypothetical protein
MPFPATKLPSVALDDIQKIAVRLRTQVKSLRDASALADTNRAGYVELQRLITNAIVQWDAVTGTPGLSQYAKDQFNDQTLDIVVEYQVMRAAAVTLRDWIYNNIPTQGTAVLLQSLGADGTLTSLTFTVAQTVQFRIEADTLINMITVSGA